jgi:catechol 2,3-dioxygenase-like lactoylglutathione lyase family enzyme
MKRFHVHVSVKDLDESVRFYSRLFGAQPTVIQPDYAKWMLEDPRVNFAISLNKCGSVPGINHLGLQVDSDAELTALDEQFAAVGLSSVQERGAQCCYAQGDKTWLQDPQGIAWEHFHTLTTVPVFGDRGPEMLRTGGACIPATGAASHPSSSCGPKAEPGCCT